MTQFFTTYAFKASPQTSTQATRTLPDRLTDVISIKDFGAVGDGVTDDTAAITAAIDYAVTVGSTVLAPTTRTRRGAIVLIPPGIYNIGSPPLVLDRDPGSSVAINYYTQLSYVGCGRDVSILRGTWNTGNTMDSSNNSFLVTANFWGGPQVVELRDLAIENLSTATLSGAYQNQSGPLHAVNCRFKGMIGYDASAAAFGGRLEGCVFECTRPITACSDSTATRQPQYITPSNLFTQFSSAASGSIGAFFPQGEFVGCIASGFDVGFSPAGYGSNTMACKAYRCGIGFLGGYNGGNPNGGGNVGGGGSGTPLPAGWGYGIHANNLMGNWVDRCTWGMFMTGGHCHIAANTFTGDTGPWDAATISSIVWSAGTATATTSVAHNLATGTNKLVLTTAASGWTPDFSGNQIVSVTASSSLPTTFTYTLSSNPSGAFSSGTWNYPMNYGIRTMEASDFIFTANSMSARYSSACFDISQAQALPQGPNTVMAMHGNSSWYLLTADAFVTPGQNEFGRIANWNFIQCGTVANHPRTMSWIEIPMTYGGAGFGTAAWHYHTYPEASEGNELNISDLSSAEFGGFACAMLSATSSSSTGSTVLTFASVPTGVSSGMLIYDTTRIALSSAAIVTAKSSNTITVSPALVGDVLTSDTIAVGGGTNHYRVRYDGTVWRRIG